MTTLAANYDYDDPSLKKFLVYSIALHGGLAVLIAVGTYFHLTGNEWSGAGNLGNSTEVKLVSSAGIPMPSPQVTTESNVVDPSKTLYKPEPPKPPEPKTSAIPLPKFDKEKPLPPSPPSKILENKIPPPPNAVPGHSGGANLPTGVSQTPGMSASGVSVQGQGGGDFASRYAWYIEAVRRKIDQNWDRFSIDPSVRSSPSMHSTVLFTINKDGSVKNNVRVGASSGNSSWDTSGVRAILGASPFPPLPNDYSGSYVDVTFDFTPH